MCIYAGGVEEKNIIKISSASRQLSDDEKQSLTVCMTVHEVAHQKDILYCKSYPEKVFVKIVAEIKFAD